MRYLTCSVVVATYNGEKYIYDQLMSIISQYRKPDYILISDDSSRDNTVEICKRVLSRSNVPYSIIQNDKPKGVAANFINAARTVTTDVVFFSDQDDIWKKEKIGTMMDVFENHPNCTEVLSDAYIWETFGNNNETVPVDRSEGSLTGFKKIAKVCSSNGEIKKDDFWRIAITDNVANGMSMAVTRGVINTKVDKAESNINGGGLMMFHDSLYNLVSGAIGTVYLVSEPLAYYRQHGSNVQGAIHSLNYSVIKRSCDRVRSSFLKVRERVSIIEELDDKFHFLNQTNTEYFDDVKRFYEYREIYIRGHRPIKMACHAIKNRKYYKTNQLMMRDVAVAFIYRNE